jgi:hypothetical protein
MDARAAVDVRQEGERVSVRAEAAPLSEVLDRLSKQLGMKVVYEGAPPRALVTASLSDRTPAEAVLGVLEGLGLDYLARMDKTGARVETLILSAPGLASGPSPVSRPTFQPTGQGRAAAPPELEEPDDEDEPEEPPATKLRTGRNGTDDSEPQRPRPGAGPQPGRPQAAPGGPAVGNPTLGAGPGNLPAYPVSPFAPQPMHPAATVPPATVPQPAAPATDEDDDTE